MESENLLRALAAAAEHVDMLTNLALVIVGASVIALLQTSYFRPADRRLRAVYLLFLPGWYFLGKSIYHGSRVRAVHLAYLFTSREVDFAKVANQDALAQSHYLLAGLPTFTIWLTLYLAWWIYDDTR